MKTMDLNFEKLFEISLFCLRFNRSHPDVPRDMKWAFQFSIMHGLTFITFCLIVYSTYYDYQNKNFGKSCANGVLGVVFIVVSCKYAVLVKHQKLLKVLIKSMKTDYESAKNFPIAEQELLLKYALKGQWVCKLWLVVGCLGAGIFPLKSVIQMIYLTFVNEFQLVPIYELIYPAALEQSMPSLIFFVLMYINLLWYAFYSTSMYIGFAPFGPILMTHICGQLELLKNRINELFPDNVDDFNREETEEKLKLIIKKLHYIYSFVEYIQVSFQMVYEVVMKGSSVVIPISLYEVIETFKMGQFNIEFLIMVIACIALTGCPCYYSDLLLEAGESLREALYMSGWEKHFDRRTRASFLIMLSRSSRSMAIRAMFRTICLDALADVYQQAYAIFNVLNATWD